MSKIGASLSENVRALLSVLPQVEGETWQNYLVRAMDANLITPDEMRQYNLIKPSILSLICREKMLVHTVPFLGKRQ